MSSSGNLRPVTVISPFSSLPFVMVYWDRVNRAQGTPRDSSPSTIFLLQLSFTAAAVGGAGPFSFSCAVLSPVFIRPVWKCRYWSFQQTVSKHLPIVCACDVMFSCKLLPVNWWRSWWMLLEVMEYCFLVPGHCVKIWGVGFFGLLSFSWGSFKML